MLRCGKRARRSGSMARARRRDVPNPPARRSRARRPAGGTGWTGETGETLETLGMRSARGVRHAAMKARRSATSAFRLLTNPRQVGGFLFFNGVMLKTPMPTQHELEMVTLEELVP
ncbi:hypothetical protein, partial [Burkholderia mallei]|uniref:hypothetical protein n=1 Tax=Burkholderia mallei TaxID=13373 RepID=UPI002040C8FA